MINNVVLIGRFTRDPELRYTPTNVAATQFNLACNRNFKNQNGEYDADFINIQWPSRCHLHSQEIQWISRMTIYHFRR